MSREAFAVFRKLSGFALVIVMAVNTNPAQALEIPMTSVQDEALIEFVADESNHNDQNLVPLIANEQGAHWFRENSQSSVRQIGTLDIYKVLVRPEVALNAINELTDKSVMANVRRAMPTAAQQLGVSDPSYQANQVVITGTDNAHTAGFTGAGYSVAILDTGIQASHPYFKNDAGDSRIVDQACFVSYPGSATLPCPNGSATDFSSNAADISYADYATQMSFDHGTHVAGIATGDKTNLASQWSYVPGGMAPDANIVPIRIFGSDGAYDSDILAGLNYVADNAAALDIASVNLSLGWSSPDDECANPGNSSIVSEYNTAFLALRANNVAPLVATGNDGYNNVISFPGCVDSAIAVGSTTSLDDISYFNNESNKLDLLAPGSDIISSVPGSDFQYMSGTSMATPAVAGAWAVLRQSIPEFTVAEWLAALRSTGTLIDGPVIQNMPRINVDAAIDSVYVMNGPDIPKNVAVTWAGFEEFTLTWTAPTRGFTPTGYRITYNGSSTDVAANIFTFTQPLITVDTSVSVAVVAGSDLGRAVIAPIATYSSGISAVTSLSSQVLVNYELGGDYCTSAVTPTIKVQYNSSSSSLRTLTAINGTGEVRAISERSITPPVGSGFVSGRAREITLSDPETWLTSTTKLYNTNSQGQVSRELALSGVFSGITTAARSPLAPANLDVVGTYESATASWAAGDSSSWRVFVDGVQSVSNVSTLELALAPGTHEIQVCALKSVGSAIYSSPKSEFEFEVLAKEVQTISVTTPGTVALSESNFQFVASADSNLALSYESLTSSTCSIDSNGSIHTIAVGECTIKTRQAGNAQYLPATDRTVSFNIVRPSPLSITAAKWKIASLKAKLSWTAPANHINANVNSYVVNWRIALKGKAFGSWKTKTVTGLSWTSLKYAKWTKLQVKVYAVGETGNSPIYSGATTIK